MKRITALLISLCIVVALLVGCGLNVSKESKSVEEMLVKQALSASPIPYDSEGDYMATFRYEEGGFEKMDLSQAYVAYDPENLLDSIKATEADSVSEETPELPEDAQEYINHTISEDQLEKIAVVTVETVDDNTVTVSFKDSDNPLAVAEYYFIIPNEGVAGTVKVEKSQEYYAEQAEKLGDKLNEEANEVKEQEQNQEYEDTDEYVEDTSKSDTGRAYDDEVIFKEE